MAAHRHWKRLTRSQQEALARMLSEVFVSLRAPGYQYFWDRQEDWNDLAKVQAAVDRSVAFAEVMHNIPLYLFRDDFDFAFHKEGLAIYAEKYPEMIHFLARLDEIEAMDERGLPADPDTRH